MDSVLEEELSKTADEAMQAGSSVRRSRRAAGLGPAVQEAPAHPSVGAGASNAAAGGTAQPHRCDALG